MNDLDALKRLLSQATPGEWQVWRPEEGRPDDTVFHRNRTVCAPAGFNLGLIAVAYCDYMTPEYAENNANLIAALRNSAPALISELESLRARMADAEKVITAVRFWDRGPFTTTSKATARLDLLDALAHFDAQEGK